MIGQCQNPFVTSKPILPPLNLEANNQMKKLRLNIIVKSAPVGGSTFASTEIPAAIGVTFAISSLSYFFYISTFIQYVVG